MGSGESKSGIDVGVFGDLDISSGFVLAGSELRGRAYVRWNPGSRVDPRTTYRVCVSVIGEEAATVEYRRDDEFYDDEWNEGPSTRRTRQITDYANATTRFLSQVLVLRDLGPRDGKVDLVFPFSFTLPPRLPTSMEHSQGRSRCSISYYALVQIIDLSSNAGGLSAGNKEHRMNFSVYNPPPPPERHFPVSIQPTTEPVNLCCCFGEGTVTIGASLPSGLAAVGSTGFEVGFWVVNESDVDIETVEMKLVQRIQFSADSHTKNEERVVGRTRVPVDPALLKKNTRSEAKLISSGSPRQQISHVEVPFATFESYVGSIVSVTHRIELIFHTGTFISNPTLRSDNIFLYRLPPSQPSAGWGGPSPAVGLGPGFAQQASAPPIPPGWNPQLEPVSSFDGSLEVKRSAR
mmetsp:Transcript_577/g.2219  ORF Transcript_577/g.2219 Transcript_577/m.2219 type:complete len:406 (+) Transcript_577:74-1291(+)